MVGLGWGSNVVSSTVTNMLGAKEKLRDSADRNDVGQDSFAISNAAFECFGGGEGILRIPPFPGSRLRHFSRIPTTSLDPRQLASAMRRNRVGGTYWGSQPSMPADHVLVRCPGALDSARELGGRRPVVLWHQQVGPMRVDGANHVIGECDPWHMLSSAALLIAEPGDEICLIAALLNVPVHLFELGRIGVAPAVLDVHCLLETAISGSAFANPFTGEPMDGLEAVELCGFWRRLIDSNRDIDGAIGFAFWKKTHVAPLLWGGATEPRFLRSATDAGPGARIAVWRTKVSATDLLALERANAEFVDVEDGFLRSRGLGADCIPPLSITVDARGSHFDPSSESELELLLERGHFDKDLVGRAGDLRRAIVEAGIGKYERATMILDRPAGTRRHVLVPGQVEDDRAVQTGGCGLVSNLELLARVRAQAPDAYILYKPHPDVLAGHRRGAIAGTDCLRYADQIVGEMPIASLIAMVDEVHVNTSLAGFEGLLRGKRVTTYGVPFYAGWGLTNDLGPVPKRRTKTRSIDELVAASLLIYPRYLDPVTGLPCPAEIVVARLIAGETSDGGLIVGMRRFQGKLMRRLRSLVQ